MQEAWHYTCKQYSGKKIYSANVWLTRKMQDVIYWLSHGDNLIDDCNVWLDEMASRYGDD